MQLFFQRRRITKISFRLSLTVIKKTYVISLFTPIRYLILLQMASYFSEPNNVKYLFPSLILRNTILLSSLIHSTHNICSFIISLHVRRESPIVLVKYCCNYMQWDSKLFFFFSHVLCSFRVLHSHRDLLLFHF